jgi:hypothetical protein
MITENDTQYEAESDKWFEDEEDPLDYQIKEYDVSSSPNDFNLVTLVSFIESGAIKIPDFQRNYVWDIKRASKLIESILIGLPVPQVFLYEEGRNSFLVIDGQQRLLSIYFFFNGRFPRKEKRVELRAIFAQEGRIPAKILEDDTYFVPFRLQLVESLPDHPNKLSRLTYESLDDLKSTFDLRTIRHVIIKQTSPAGDDSAMFEIFNRLNTGGINLKPQEIRTSLYHSPFYSMIYRINAFPKWRRLIGIGVADLNMKDCEVILRSIAMLVSGSTYQPSMIKFLNQFSRQMKAAKPEQIEYLERLFSSFLDACTSLPDRCFIGNRGRFSISIFESVFAAVCGECFSQRELVTNPVPSDLIVHLKNDDEFMEAAQKTTAGKANVEKRLRIAREKLALTLV